MNIGKEKISKIFLDKISLSGPENYPYSDYKGCFVEEKLNLGGYGYVDLFFYKKIVVNSENESDEEAISVMIVTICSNLIGFDEILKSSRSKVGVFKYLREIVGIPPTKRIYYGNTIICPGTKEDGFDILTKDISDLQVFIYDIDSSGFNLYNTKDRLRQLVPSNKVLKTIKRRLS